MSAVVRGTAVQNDRRAANEHVINARIGKAAKYILVEEHYSAPAEA